MRGKFGFKALVGGMVLFTALLSFSSLALASRDAGWGYGAKASQQSAGTKFTRGVVNMVTSIVEIPRNIHNTTEETSMLAGWTWGAVKGLGWGVIRALAGVYDVVTFPFPIPEDYRPILEPEFVWHAEGPRYK
ncbi:MAG: exosortase system-associated protein, TIGR04073 family [Candidatus Omnitrophica bacterium]|nr:exosortase system-associated protein, TIGR04073 family [Candidatus Omnitrophota bacterium]